MLKKRGLLWDSRIDSKSEINDLIIKEDLLNPEKEKVNIYFRGNGTSGILIFDHEEIAKLSRSLKSKTGLIRKSGKLRA